MKVLVVLVHQPGSSLRRLASITGQDAAAYLESEGDIGTAEVFVDHARVIEGLGCRPGNSDMPATTRARMPEQATGCLTPSRRSTPRMARHVRPP